MSTDTARDELAKARKENEMAAWTVWYETRSETDEWVYRTQALTPHHAVLRGVHADAYTLRFDAAVDWPLGVYAETIFRSRVDLEREAARKAARATR